MWLFLCFALIFPEVLMFRQSRYNVSFERLEVFKYNSNYVEFVRTHNFKYNRTYTAVNITIDIKKDFERKLRVELQAYKFTSNEYRFFPLRFGFDFCTFAETNDLGFHRFFECGNLTSCPIKAGLYRMCNWGPDSSRFPPNIPKGSYMLDLIFYLESVEVFFLQGYATIKYPEI